MRFYSVHGRYEFIVAENNEYTIGVELIKVGKNKKSHQSILSFLIHKKSADKVAKAFANVSKDIFYIIRKKS